MVNSTLRVGLEILQLFCINQCKPKSRNETVLALGHFCPLAQN